MLHSLEIRDFVIVGKATLELESGFTALTGETGAGKSILVDALELLVGGRADAGVVREGAERAELWAHFDLTGAQVGTWLDEAGLEGDPGQILLRRTIDRSGRSRCFINGHPATLVQLREVGERLVDIHGQHAHQSLLRAAAQRELLDAHAGAADLARQCAEAFRDWKRLERLAREAQENSAARQAERAALEADARELEKLGPRAGEWQALSAEQARLAHGASLLAGAEASLEALADADDALLGRLSVLASRLQGLSQHDARLQATVELLRSAEAQAGEAARELRHYAERIELDPDALRAVEARIEALHAAARRHRVRPEALPERLAELQARLAELALAVDAQALEREVAAACARFMSAAQALSAKRSATALTMSSSVTAEMQRLALAGAKFAVTLRPLEAPSSGGLEEIEFEVAAHPSLPLRPLAKVASGGELSRISLAVQLVAAKSSPVGTLVFDEIDSGIGGAVAGTIGKALRRLGSERQVLCVTHLPQVAAAAHEHWNVVKSGARGRLAVQTMRLERAQRIDELARMLGGAERTARKHAAELLEAG